MQVERTKENLRDCRCRDCPSYTMGCKVMNYPLNLLKLAADLDNVEHFEGMFCAFEKSHCIEEDKGCLCEDCPVHAKYDLVRDDYCLKTGGEISKTCKAGYVRKS